MHWIAQFSVLKMLRWLSETSLVARFTFDTLGTPYGVVGLLRGHIKGNRQTTSEDLAAGNPKKPSPTMFSPLIHDRP